jgi:hypothetical protein
MNSSAIIYPAIIMFTMTLALVLSMGIRRYIAVKQRAVNHRYYVAYNEGEETPSLHILSRHVRNHFEVPPLFYIGILFIYVTGSVTQFAVAAAWLFVMLRFLHTLIHMGSNNVRRRFFAFALSLIALGAMWGSLLTSLVRQSA